MTFPYVYFWYRQGRKGRFCRVTARGKMNSCRVEFEDGYVMITSRNALRKRPAQAGFIPGSLVHEPMNPTQISIE